MRGRDTISAGGASLPAADEDAGAGVGVGYRGDVPPRIRACPLLKDVVRRVLDDLCCEEPELSIGALLLFETEEPRCVVMEERAAADVGT